jgi:RNA polymerase sporulation-specific sigma factor
MQDEELALLFQGGCHVAIDPLVVRYDGLVRATAKRYFLQGADQDDLVQEGRIGLCNAVRSFRKDKHQRFDTFAELCVRRRVQSAIRAATRRKHAPLNQALPWSPDPAGPAFAAIATGLQPDDSVNLNLLLCDQLTPLEGAVLKGYLAGHSYLEMGRSLSCLPKSVDNALQRAKRKILNVLSGP